MPVFCPSLRDGRYLWFFRTGADVSPLQGRAYIKMSTRFQKTKDIPAGLGGRGLMTVVGLFSGFADIRL